LCKNFEAKSCQNFHCEKLVVLQTSNSSEFRDKVKNSERKKINKNTTTKKEKRSRQNQKAKLKNSGKTETFPRRKKGTKLLLPSSESQIFNAKKRLLEISLPFLSTGFLRIPLPVTSLEKKCKKRVGSFSVIYFQEAKQFEWKKLPSLFIFFLG
jgi:hypothetical protein